ncbi:MAG: Ig domain-containing protein [Candidatus Sulfotelmatobacter sp.]
MSCSFPHGVKKACANRSFLLQSLLLRSLLKPTVFPALVFALVFLNGCSGNSVPPASTPTATPPAAAASLNISAALPPATVGTNYTGSLTVTGGTAPYIFSVASGQLPNGTALADNSGAVTGTPTASGNFTFDVSVSDATGASQQKSLQIAVASPPAATTGGSGGSGSGSGSSGSGTGSGSSGTASNAASGAKSFSSLQHSGGWAQYGQIGPNYVDCSPSPCNGIAFSMTQNVTSPSISGEASEFNVGGSAPFGDGLFNNHLIGPGSSQGLPDSNNTLVPTLHNFTYDVYFYGDNLGLSQALEFDINQFFDNNSYIWGHECRIASGNEWDVWDNQNQQWKPTGVPCHPNSNSWNHLTIQVQRNSNDELVYQSITLNGVTYNLNWTFPHGSAQGWYGVTINYQMDGNSQQNSYNVYLDNLTFSYQ